MRIGFWWESQKEAGHYKYLYIGWRITLRCILREIVWGSMDWIDLAQYGDRWRALMTTKMGLWAIENIEKFLSG
jgi:hypothetical protein